jgi:uncharacterized membrane protein YphA (DoxX/SURF4 family)
MIQQLDKYKKYAPLVVRIGVSLVFLWFGLNQIFQSNFFLGYLPTFAMNLPIEPTLLIIGNGIFETIFGLMLLAGLYTRISSLVLAIHLFGITVSLGYNEIAVRDFGLTLATLSVFFHGVDEWCYDRKRKQNKLLDDASKHHKKQ